MARDLNEIVNIESMNKPVPTSSQHIKYDVFISHASEDKQDVARPLASMLVKAGLRVWLDESELLLGDSLRRKIDAGLASSNFGIVILSKAFFAKEWPQKELDALVAREDGSGKVILPVWHNISRQEVIRFSPTLGDKLGVDTTSGLNAVLSAICNAVRPHINNLDHDSNSQEATSTASKSVQDLMIEFLDDIEEKSKNPMDSFDGLRTGFYDLDRLTLGLQPGELHVVAARPSIGCTTFVLNIASHVALKEGLPVIFYSSSSRSKEIFNRFVASSGRIDRMHLSTGRLSDEEWPRLVEAMERIREAPLYIDDTSPMSIESIEKAVNIRSAQNQAVGLLVVDSFDGLNLRRSKPLSELAIEKLCQLARQINCAVIVTMSLPKKVEARLDKRPRISDIECQDVVERLSTSVTLLYRDDFYHRDSLNPNLVEVIVAKNRLGLTGVIHLLLDKSISSLENVSTDF